jgi:DNA helicase-2/ATP-dependent DNA helicase PcrA
MDMRVIQITSDFLINDIEHNFRISAGPGAGKTHWIVEHIKNVLHRSNRLAKTRKIACITYTNIAVETILNRLDASTGRVEVSTIHSFLYKNIVKPYASFIASEYSLNIDKMDGHDADIISNYSFLKEWKTRTGQQRIRNDNEVVAAIKKAKWKLEGMELLFRPPYPMKADNYAIKSDSYFEYKKMAWDKGIVHHEDVLFFSYHLIKKYPFILDVLCAKFPYFFVDEFQDTSPIQTAIIQKIGQGNTKIGIIGDVAQSIFGFQGAEPDNFTSFNLPEIIDYQIPQNRRSTNQIIKVLNKIRSDIHQESFKNKTGIRPVIIVGEMVASLRRSMEICSGEKIYSLSRDNITSNALKRDISGISLDNKLIDKLLETDKPGKGNKYRSKLIVACIKATELARQGNYKDSIKEFEKALKNVEDKTDRKRKALSHIVALLDRYDTFMNASLYEFYSLVKNEIYSDISNLRIGKPKAFYEKHTYQQLSLCVNIVEDTSQHKTIHKAKGDEFDNVLLILKEEDDLGFLLAPDLKGSEEQRIYYVAASRAKERLFITVPTMQKKDLSALSDRFQIEVLG